MACSFIPPYLLRRLADGRHGLLPDARDCCRNTLLHDERMRARRAAGPDPAGAQADDWVVHDAQNAATLPGLPVRRSGDPAVEDPDSVDPAVDEAAEGTTASLRLLSQLLGRDSYDGSGATVLVTVHYERDYVNAF